MASTSQDTFSQFYSDLKQTEKRDATLTPTEQIDRLLKPGASYLNLNPFEVLQIEHTASMDEIKSRYRRMSILLHPDKNRDNAERAQKAFDIFTKAYKSLEDSATMAKFREVCQEAKARTDMEIQEKRRLLKRVGKEPYVEEDDPEKYHKKLRLMTVKCFVDREQRKNNLTNMQEFYAQREKDQAEDEKMKSELEEEYAKMLDQSRDSRTSSWKKFQTGGKKTKEKKRLGGFKPPKPKPEQRL